MSPINLSSPIKRLRRTRAETAELLNAVLDVLDDYNGDRIRIRHLFYRLESKKVIAKALRRRCGPY